jgi:hypothetical protein
MDKNLSDNSAPIMSEANAQNHANFAGAFIMTGKIWDVHWIIGLRSTNKNKRAKNK